MSEMIQVQTESCMVCGRASRLQVRKEGFKKWEEGAMIQVAFPDMTKDEREMLINGTHPDCWDSLFPPDEEEE